MEGLLATTLRAFSRQGQNGRVELQYGCLNQVQSLAARGGPERKRQRRLRPPLGATATDYAPWKDFVEQFSKILLHVDFDRAYDLLVRSGPLVVELESSTEGEQEEDELTATRRRVESLEAANKRLRTQNVALARRARRHKRLARVSAPNAWLRRRSSCSWCYVEGEATGTFPRAVVSLWLHAGARAA